MLGLGIAIWDAGLKIWGLRTVTEMYSNAKQNQIVCVSCILTLVKAAARDDEPLGTAANTARVPVSADGKPKPKTKNSKPNTQSPEF